MTARSAGVVISLSLVSVRSTLELDIQRAIESLREPPPPPPVPEARPVFRQQAPKPRNPRVAGADIRRFIPRRTA